MFIVTPSERLRRYRSSRTRAGARIGYCAPSSVGDEDGRRSVGSRSAGAPASFVRQYRELAGEALLGQRVLLPHGVVGVLDRERRQGGRHARAVAPIERFQLVEQNAERPSIRHDVMHGHQQQRVAALGREQHGSEERTGSQIEGTLCLERRQPLQLATHVCLARAGHGYHAERRVRGGTDVLNRARCRRAKHRAQHAVTALDLRQGLTHRQHVDRTLEGHGRGNVVRGAAPLPLIEEPEPLLSVGGGQPAPNIRRPRRPGDAVLPAL